MPALRRSAAALLLLAAMAAGAQEAPQPGATQPAATQPAATQPAAASPAPAAKDKVQATFGRPRYMVYFFEAEQDTLTPPQKFVLYNSILAAAAEANRDVVLLESPDQSVPTTREGREELARRINADSWLSIVASGGFSNITIQAETFDILRQKTFGQEIIRPGFIVDYRTIATGFWDGISTAIRENYTRVVDLSSLTIRGRPGTELTGVPGGPYTIDASGTIVRQVPYPSAFSLRARIRGYYDVERPLFLGIDPLVIDLGQVAKPWFGAELNLSSLQFPGVRFWVSIIPASVFVRLGITTQLAGLYLIDNAPGLLITGAPLSYVELDAGLYLNPPDQLLRFYVAAGGYLRVTHPPAPDFRIDTEAAPGAITLSIGGEFSPSRRIRLIADYQPAFILASDPARFIALSFVPNSFPSGSVPGYVVLPWGLFDLRNIYLGVRMDF